MNIFHHKQIAKAIHAFMLEKYNINIDKKAFIIGSMIPDAPFYLKGIKHKKDESFEFIKELIIQKASSIEFRGMNKLTKKSSLYFGVIAHFITDYFCCYHNATDKTKYSKHYSYENYLHRQFNSFSKPALNEIIDYTCNKSLLYNNVMDFIEGYHYKYLSSPHNDRKDIIYSLGMAASIVYSMVCRNSYSFSNAA